MFDRDVRIVAGCCIPVKIKCKFSISKPVSGCRDSPVFFKYALIFYHRRSAHHIFGLDEVLMRAVTYFRSNGVFSCSEAVQEGKF